MSNKETPKDATAMLIEPAVEIFGPNKFVLAIIGLFTFGTAASARSMMNNNTPDGEGLVLALVVFGVSVVYLIWLLSVRVSFYRNGLSYRTLFGAKKILWAEVEHFYYQATKRSVNLIPIGTYYSFKLVTGRGERIYFDNQIERPAIVGNHLIEMTYPLLLHKSINLFNSGTDLSFGPIRLGRSLGIRVKKLFWAVNIPLESVADYRIDHGIFYVWRVGRKRATGVPIGRIPNVFVLVGVLNAFYGRE